MNDANLDAYALVLYLFKLKFGESESFVYLQDVRAFLQEFAPFFQGDDLREFIKEIEMSQKMDGDRVEVAQIASTIKHAAEGFPM